MTICPDLLNYQVKEFSRHLELRILLRRIWSLKKFLVMANYERITPILFKIFAKFVDNVM
jgi:hypothetical protein